MSTIFIVFLFFCWASWHWFLRDFFERRGLNKTLKSGKENIKRRTQAFQTSENDLYEQAYNEVTRDEIHKGIWARAWSKCQGDEQKAKALYLRLRVAELRKEITADSFANSSQESENKGSTDIEDKSELLVECPNCRGTFYNQNNYDGLRSCPWCSADLRVKTIGPPSAEVIGPSESQWQWAGRIGRLQCFTSWLVSTIVAAFFIGISQGESGYLQYVHYGLILIIPFYHATIFAARLHDLGHSGWLALISLIPFINLLMLAYLVVPAGDPLPNKFGKPGSGVLLEET